MFGKCSVFNLTDSCEIVPPDPSSDVIYQGNLSTLLQTDLYRLTLTSMGNLATSWKTRALLRDDRVEDGTAGDSQR